MNAKKASIARPQLLSLLIHQIYGIKLKWETHTEDVVWGKGVLRGDGNHLTLHKKGVVLPDPETHPGPEGTTWVDRDSPYAPLVWKSHFLPSCRSASGMP